MIRNRNHRVLSTGALTAAATIIAWLPADANAYDYVSCGGGALKWGSPAGIRQNLCSISSGGNREAALNAAKARWNNIGAMDNMLSTLYPPSTSCLLFNDDVFSDVYFVSELSGAEEVVGRELSMSIGCEIVVSDVIIEAGSSVLNPSETYLGPNARATLVHEFGHTLGLEHWQGFNMMREAHPTPLIGGSGEHIDALPDDAQGGRALYPQGGSETNLFASAHRRDSGSDTITTNTGEGPVYSCSGGGGQITITATVGNNGTTNVTQTEKWYVSQSPTAYGGTTISTWTNSTFNANGVNHRNVTMTLPALSVGAYFLFHKVDALGAIGESNETDNAARELLTIHVISC